MNQKSNVFFIVFPGLLLIATSCNETVKKMKQSNISSSTPVQKEQNNKTISDSEHWKVEVEKTLKLFGHRNWIVVADVAYPQQSNQSIKTITIDANQLKAVEFINKNRKIYGCNYKYLCREGHGIYY